MIFVARPVFCQKKIPLRPVNDVLFYYKKAGISLYKPHRFAPAVAAAGKTDVMVPVTAISPRLPLLAANYYSSNFGFFCKKELQLEKITKVPFKFRLGSVEQCDLLEGKKLGPISNR